MAILRVERLTRRFGPRTVLADVDLEVASGETVVVLGPNGAGKSTLLRCCAGWIEPHGGSVRVDDLMPVDAARQQRIAASHGDGFVRRLDLEANLLWHARLLGLSTRVARTRIACLADELGFREPLRLPAERCSAGQRARAALARALLGSPALLLFDEPLRCIDPASRAPLAEAVRRHAPDAALLWVTHDMAEARRVGDRAIRIDDGHAHATHLLRAA